MEITGDSEKITALVDMLKDYGIEEMVRTGAIAINRGRKMLKDDRNKEDMTMAIMYYDQDANLELLAGKR